MFLKIPIDLIFLNIHWHSVKYLDRRYQWSCIFVIVTLFFVFTRVREITIVSWWQHQMETFSTLLALCEKNSPVTGEFPSQRPVTRSFGVFLRYAEITPLYMIRIHRLLVTHWVLWPPNYKNETADLWYWICKHWLKALMYKETWWHTCQYRTIIMKNRVWKVDRHTMGKLIHGI